MLCSEPRQGRFLVVREGWLGYELDDKAPIYCVMLMIMVVSEACTNVLISAGSTI